MTEAPAKILVVDDDDEIRSLLQVVLTREGFDVQQAKDAPAARRLLGARNDVDLIILDVMMPGEDGLSFCQSLRESNDTPILMVSARSLSIDRSIGLDQATILGPSETIPVRAGKLLLGTWQAIYLYEHRIRAHRREVVLVYVGR